MTDRYQVGGAEGQFEPGSGDMALANKLGIVDPDEMADLKKCHLCEKRELNKPGVRLQSDVCAAATF